MAPDALADESLWMQWWVRGQDGPVRLRPQLDPRTSDLRPAPDQLTGTFVELSPDVTMARSPALQWLLVVDWRRSQRPVGVSP